jgi:hypothetical protein
MPSAGHDRASRRVDAGSFGWYLAAYLNGGGTLSPYGRENSPYRHPANKDSISTPELGGVFCYPLAEGQVVLCPSPLASET